MFYLSKSSIEHYWIAKWKEHKNLIQVMKWMNEGEEKKKKHERKLHENITWAPINDIYVCVFSSQWWENRTEQNETNAIPSIAIRFYSPRKWYHASAKRELLRYKCSHKIYTLYKYMFLALLDGCDWLLSISHELQESNHNSKYRQHWSIWILYDVSHSFCSRSSKQPW